MIKIKNHKIKSLKLLYTIKKTTNTYLVFIISMGADFYVSILFNVDV